MSHATQGPPLEEEEDPTGVRSAPSSDTAVLPSDSDAPPGDRDRSSTVDREELRAYLGLATTQSRIFALVKSLVSPKTPQSSINEMRQEACVMALTAKSLPRSAQTMPAWLATVTRRAVIHHFRRGANDLNWLNREADAEQQPGEAPDPADDARLVSNWLASAVAGDDRDEETYEMLRYKGRSGKTDAEVAEDHGISYAAWTNRLSRFKQKYLPRWRRRRQLMIILWLGGAAAVAMLAAWLFSRVTRKDIGPDPAPPVPSAGPAHAVPVNPSDTPFEPALPTAPDRKP